MSKLKALFASVPRVRLAMSAGPKSPPSPVTTYYLLLVPVLCLISVGFVMVFSASTVTRVSGGSNPFQGALRDIGIMVLSLVVMFVSTRLSPKTWKYLTIPAFVGSAGLQSLVLTSLGLERGGNSNWVQLPGLPVFQPAEALKVAFILVLAYLLSRKQLDPRNPYHMSVHLVLPTVVSLIFVMLGGDMGTALVFVAIAAVMAIIAGMPNRWWIAAVPVGLAIMVGLVVAAPSRLRRIWEAIPGLGSSRNPSAPTQIDHSLWALGAGGLTGQGPGASKEKWNYLSAAESDFILAVFGEEFGLFGTLFLVACFCALALGFYRMSVYHQLPYARAVAAGVGAWICSQAAINMGMVVDITPVIGVPLPLISTGGSAFLFTTLGLGLVLSLARRDVGMEGAFGVRSWLSQRSRPQMNFRSRGRLRRRRGEA